MEISIEEGKRLNSSNYICNGYRYTKYREVNEEIYLRCSLAKRYACNGLAKVPLEITKTQSF